MSDAPPPRLRVLHVSEPHSAGVLTLVRHFTAEQSAAGHDVHLLAPPGMPVLDGVQQHRWSIERGRLSTYPAAVRELRRVVAQVRPDVVHLHSFFAGLLGRLPLLSGTSRVPVVYQPHAWSTGVFASAAATRLVTVLERSGGRRTDVLVANCLDEIAAGRELGVDVPSHELGVAVDGSVYRPPTPAEREQARRTLGVEDQRVLLVLGRIARQKGQDQLLEAWEARPLPGAVLVLVGPGDTTPLEGSAPREWGRSVRAAGEPSEVLPWLWAADLLLLPSRYETVGLVVAEAMATGVPVVTTAVHGARATVEEPTTLGAHDLAPAGAVVALGDAAGLLREAERRLDDDELRRRESAAALERAAALFVPQDVAARLEDAYRHAVRLTAGTTPRTLARTPARTAEENHS